MNDVSARQNCVICLGRDGDPELQRLHVWEDDLWRLTMSLGAEVAGFSYLEPKRHIPHITDLDGDEARSFGQTLASVTRVLREEAGAEVVYVFIFGGGVPHLHVHLAPHSEGDALNDQMIKGEIEERKLPSGATAIVSKEFPFLPGSLQREVAERVRARLESW